jgi:hypothetical protein
MSNTFHKGWRRNCVIRVTRHAHVSDLDLRRFNCHFGSSGQASNVSTAGVAPVPRPEHRRGSISDLPHAAPTKLRRANALYVMTEVSKTETHRRRILRPGRVCGSAAEAAEVVRRLAFPRKRMASGATRSRASTSGTLSWAEAGETLDGCGPLELELGLQGSVTGPDGRQTILQKCSEPLQILFLVTLAHVIVPGILDPPVPLGTGVGRVQCLAVRKGHQFIALPVDEVNRNAHPG